MNWCCETKLRCCTLKKKKKVTAHFAFVGDWPTFSENAQIDLFTGQLQTDSQKIEPSVLFPGGALPFTKIYLFWILHQSSLNICTGRSVAARPAKPGLSPPSTASALLTLSHVLWKSTKSRICKQFSTLCLLLNYFSYSRMSAMWLKCSDHFWGKCFRPKNKHTVLFTHTISLSLTCRLAKV